MNNVNYVPEGKINQTQYKLLLKHLSFAVYNATLSKALNKAVGCCLVPLEGGVPIGSYNGPPRGIPEISNLGRFSSSEQTIIMSSEQYKKGEKIDPRYLLGYTSGNGLMYQIDVHAEANAIYNAARAGVSTVGASMYLTCPLPCKECAKSIIQAGVSEVWCVESKLGLTPEDCEYNWRFSRYLFEKSPVNLHEYPQSILDEAINLIDGNKIKEMMKF